jgi:hypothetical protein
VRSFEKGYISNRPINAHYYQGFLIPQVLSTLLTNNLDRGVRRLLAMWVFVKRDLELHFSMLEKPEQGSDHDDASTLAAQQVVAVDLFKVSVVHIFIELCIASATRSSSAQCCKLCSAAYEISLC